MTHHMETRESAAATLRTLSESELENVSGGSDASIEAITRGLINAISGWCDGLSASNIRGICN